MPQISCIFIINIYKYNLYKYKLQKIGAYFNYLSTGHKECTWFLQNLQNKKHNTLLHVERNNNNRI